MQSGDYEVQHEAVELKNDRTLQNKFKEVLEKKILSLKEIYRTPKIHKNNSK